MADREVNIRVVKPLDGVYAEYQPEEGKVYRAELRRYRSGKRIGELFCLVPIRGKKIIVRKGEFEIVEENNGSL